MQQETVDSASPDLWFDILLNLNSALLILGSLVLMYFVVRSWRK